MTNILVTAMLLTGGSAVITSLTGMSTVAACFLLPLGVAIYTMFGGIKATFLTDWVSSIKLFGVTLLTALGSYIHSADHHNHLLVGYLRFKRPSRLSTSSL
jgi:Na+/proline symporter